MKQILFLTGKICSGKTYFAKHHAPNHTYLSVSSIVKGLISSDKRSELQTTSNLSKQITNEIIRFIIQSLLNSDKILIDGIRQRAIIMEIISYFKPSIITGDLNFRLVWLEEDEEVLKRRYCKQNDKKNDIPFEEALQRDNELGLFEIESIVNSYRWKYEPEIGEINECYHSLEPWCEVFILKGEINE